MNGSANFLIKKKKKKEKFNERLYFTRFIEQTIQCFTMISIIRLLEKKKKIKEVK